MNLLNSENLKLQRKVNIEISYTLKYLIAESTKSESKSFRKEAVKHIKECWWKKFSLLNSKKMKLQRNGHVEISQTPKCFIAKSTKLDSKSFRK